GFGRKLQVIEVGSGNVVLETGFDDMISALFDPSSRRLFVARTDGIVEVREGLAWSVATRLAYTTPSPRPKDIALALNSDGDRIAVAPLGNRKVYVLPNNGEPAVELSGHKEAVVDVLFDATGRRVVTR
ncbi:MAG: hypothetical protein ACREXU_18405, partial [Gammaproteobacteria bacterium]